MQKPLTTPRQKNYSGIFLLTILLGIIIMVLGLTAAQRMTPDTSVLGGQKPSLRVGVGDAWSFKSEKNGSWLGNHFGESKLTRSPVV